jgi:hypothetical protein
MTCVLGAWDQVFHAGRYPNVRMNLWGICVRPWDAAPMACFADATGSGAAETPQSRKPFRVL